MPRQCTVCNHPERAKIDRAIVIDKTSNRAIASQFRVSKDAVARHRPHISQALVEAGQTRELTQSGRLLDGIHDAEARADRLYCHAEGILEKALEAKDLKTALQAIKVTVEIMREARGYMELKGHVSGELRKDTHPINVLAPDATFYIPLPGLPALPAPAPIEVEPKEDE